jgi:hypothetical protein
MQANITSMFSCLSQLKCELTLPSAAKAMASSSLPDPDDRNLGRDAFEHGIEDRQADYLRWQPDKPRTA